MSFPSSEVMRDRSSNHRDYLGREPVQTSRRPRVLRGDVTSTESCSMLFLGKDRMGASAGSQQGDRRAIAFAVSDRQN